MLVDMVRMREGGNRRLPDSVKAGPVQRGMLTLERAEVPAIPPSREMEMAAFLRCMEHGVQPIIILYRLHEATVTRIGEDSFIVAGTEAVGYYREQQSWWCRLARESDAWPIGSAPGQRPKG